VGLARAPSLAAVLPPLRGRASARAAAAAAAAARSRRTLAARRLANRGGGGGRQAVGRRGGGGLCLYYCRCDHGLTLCVCGGGEGGGWAVHGRWCLAHLLLPGAVN
jgi:hypothetical protein